MPLERVSVHGSDAREGRRSWSCPGSLAILAGGRTVKAICIITVATGLIGLGCGEGQPPAEPAASVAEVSGSLRADACPEPEGVPPERVLARICGRAITVEDVQERLGTMSARARERYRDPARLRDLLEDLVRFEVLLVEAERRGLDGHPEVERARAQAMVRVFVREEFQDAPGLRLSDIGDDEVEAYYGAHPDEFNDPERVRGSHILVSDRELGERLLSRILAAPAEADLFARLAEEHSEDQETRERGGDLGYFARPAERRAAEPEVPPEAAEAAFSLERIGEVHPRLVQGAAGWHIVKLTGRHEAWHRTLEEARSRIRNRLVQERRRERISAFAEEARGRLGVELNVDALGLVQVPGGGGTR